MPKVKKEVVRFKNQMNDIQIGKLSAVCQDLFYSVCFKVHNKGAEQVTISYKELKNLANYRRLHASKEQISIDVGKMMDGVLGLQGVLEDGSKTGKFNFFSYYINDPDNEELCVKVNSDFSYLVNGLAGNFTQFELKEITELSGGHSKTLYRLLKQYSNTGRYIVPLKKLKYLFGVENKYKEPKEFVRRVISPAVKEISPYFPNLSYTYDKAKDGKTITGFVFEFDKKERRKKSA